MILIMTVLVVAPIELGELFEMTWNRKVSFYEGFMYEFL